MKKSNLQPKADPPRADKMQNDNVKCKISLVSPILLMAVILALIAVNIINGQTKEHDDANAQLGDLTHFASPIDKQFYEDAFAFAKYEEQLEGVVAGIIPHHLLAADLIARFFAGVEGNEYDTVVLIGPNHFSAGQGSAIGSAAAWRTPYGELEPDQELLQGLKAGDLATVDEEAIANEHAITSEAAFIKRTFPGAKFLPLILKPSVSIGSAVELGESIKALAGDRKVLVLASVDFSHYRDSATAQADDKNSIAAIASGDPAAVYQAALDSPASITAVMAFAQAAGATFVLKENSNSAVLSDQPDLKETTSYVTGYFVGGLSSPDKR